MKIREILEVVEEIYQRNPWLEQYAPKHLEKSIEALACYKPECLDSYDSIEAWLLERANSGMEWKPFSTYI